MKETVEKKLIVLRVLLNDTKVHIDQLLEKSEITYDDISGLYGDTEGIAYYQRCIEREFKK